MTLDRGPVFAGVKVGRPAAGALIDAGYSSLSDLPEDLDPLTELHGVGPKAVQLLKEARPADDPRPELIATSDAWARAIVSNDAEQIGGFMADDWVIVSDRGVTAKEEFLALVRSGQLTHTAMDRVTEPRIRVYGDTAVLTSRVTNTAHHAGAQFDADEWTTDVFTRRDGRWVCVLSHITPAG